MRRQGDPRTSTLWLKLTEGAARKALQSWAYKNARVIGRYRAKPGPGTNKKDRACAWLLGLSKQKLEKYLYSAMPDIDTITYRVGTAPEAKKVTKESLFAIQEPQVASRMAVKAFATRKRYPPPPPRKAFLEQLEVYHQLGRGQHH